MIGYPKKIDKDKYISVLIKYDELLKNANEATYFLMYLHLCMQTPTYIYIST